MESLLSQRFCDYPFTFAEIHPNGDVFCCCPAWCGLRSIGNIFRDTPTALWNSVQAQNIRAGIIDGSFRCCEHEVCPLIVGGRLPLRREGDPVSITVAHGPLTVKLCHDNTCNLSCPSCRKAMVVANRERQAQLDHMLHEFIVPFLADARTLFLSGDGDPFASKHYRDILRETAGLPLRIQLHTNGLLCDAKAWDNCRLWGRVDEVLISIDAATHDTYRVVRRGGDLTRLMRNLRFLSEERRKKQFRHFSLAFVVQKLNFHEMPAFVQLGLDLGADEVCFSLLQQWGAMSDAEFKEAAVCDPMNPLHRELLEVLRKPIFRDPIVNMGNIACAYVSTFAADAHRGATHANT